MEMPTCRDEMNANGASPVLDRGGAQPPSVLADFEVYDRDEGEHDAAQYTDPNNFFTLQLPENVLQPTHQKQDLDDHLPGPGEVNVEWLQGIEPGPLTQGMGLLTGLSGGSNFNGARSLFSPTSSNSPLPRATRGLQVAGGAADGGVALARGTLDKPHGDDIDMFEKHLKPFYDDRQQLSTRYWDRYLTTGLKDAWLIARSILLDEWTLRDISVHDFKRATGSIDEHTARIHWYCGWKYCKIYIDHTKAITDLRRGVEHFSVVVLAGEQLGIAVPPKTVAQALDALVSSNYTLFKVCTKDLADLDNAITAGEKCLGLKDCPPEIHEKVFWSTIFAIVKKYDHLSNTNTQITADTKVAVADKLLLLLQKYGENKLRALLDRHDENQASRNNDGGETSLVASEKHRIRSDDIQISPLNLSGVGNILYEHYEQFPPKVGDTACECLGFAIDFYDYAVRLTKRRLERYTERVLRLVACLTLRYKRLRSAAEGDLEKATRLCAELSDFLGCDSPGEEVATAKLKHKAWTSHWQSTHSLLRIRYNLDPDEFETSDALALKTLGEAIGRSHDAIRYGRAILSKMHVRGEKDLKEAVEDLLTWSLQFEEALCRKVLYCLASPSKAQYTGVRESEKCLNEELEALSKVNETMTPTDRWVGKAQALVTRAWLLYIQSLPGPGAQSEDETTRAIPLNEAIKIGMRASFLAQDLARESDNSEVNSAVVANAHIALSVFYLARHNLNNTPEDLDEAARYSTRALARSKREEYRTIQARLIYARACASRAAVLEQRFRTPEGYDIHLREAITYQETAVAESCADRLMWATHKVTLGKYYEAVKLEELPFKDQEGSTLATYDGINSHDMWSFVDAAEFLVERGDVQMHPIAQISITSLITVFCESLRARALRARDEAKAGTRLAKIHSEAQVEDPKVVEEVKSLLDVVFGLIEEQVETAAWNYYSRDHQLSLLAILSKAHAGYPDPDQENHLQPAIKWVKRALEKCNKHTPSEFAELNYRLGILHSRLPQNSNSEELRRTANTILEPLKLCLNQEKAPVQYRLEAAMAASQVLQDLQRWGDLYDLMKVAIAILPQVSLLALPRRDQHALVNTIGGLGSIAAAAALEKGDDTVRIQEALILLESARDLISGKYFDTRADIAAIRTSHPEFAERFDALTYTLDSGSVHAAAGAPVPSSQHDTDKREGPSTGASMLKRLELSSWSLLERGRNYLGVEKVFNSFVETLNNHHIPLPSVLKSRQGSHLIEAAGDGTIVVVNVTSWRCDALIVRKTGFSLCKLPGLRESDIDAHLEAKGAVLTSDGSSSLVDPDGRPESFWVWMWRTIGERVLDFLNFKEDTMEVDSLNDPAKRVWWLMTRNSCRLPIHAAVSTEEPGVMASRVCGRVLCSYTSSIKALIFSREQHLRRQNQSGDTTSSAQPLEALLCGLRTTKHDDEWRTRLLMQAEEEVMKIQDILKKPPSDNVQVTKWTSPDAKSVVNALSPLVVDIPSPSIFHFAGHGYSSSTDPTASGLYLSDAPLDVSLLLKAKIWQAGPILAYLSACSTGATTLLPDERVNIMSGFITAGFMNVIGTLWQVNDDMSHDIAVLFYSHWATVGFNPELAAWSLQAALVEGAIDEGRVPEEWACFVHTGI